MTRWWYNSVHGILAFCALFLLGCRWYGKVACPCPARSGSPDLFCFRKEFYGAQLNHLALFIVLGAVFPDFFGTFMVLGFLFEISQAWLDHNEAFAISHVGGCLLERPAWWRPDKPYDTHVFAGETKPQNPIDAVFGIRNSRVHGWHGSMAEVLINAIGFVIGMLGNRLGTWAHRQR